VTAPSLIELTFKRDDEVDVRKVRRSEEEEEEEGGRGRGLHERDEESVLSHRTA
jgi:hypothetical protein